MNTDDNRILVCVRVCVYEGKVERWMLRFFMDGSGILMVCVCLCVLVCVFSRVRGGEERWREIWGCWF